jgi:putative IMPACT (imprinted ancient) family translation regulator
MKHNRKKFEKDIQHILEKFELKDESRRQIFSLIMEYADQQPTEKAIPNDKTSESSESNT